MKNIKRSKANRRWWAMFNNATWMVANKNGIYFSFKSCDISVKGRKFIQKKGINSSAHFVHDRINTGGYSSMYHFVVAANLKSLKSYKS